MDPFKSEGNLIDLDPSTPRVAHQNPYDDSPELLFDTRHEHNQNNPFNDDFIISDDEDDATVSHHDDSFGRRQVPLLSTTNNPERPTGLFNGGNLFGNRNNIQTTIHLQILSASVISIFEEYLVVSN